MTTSPNRTAHLTALLEDASLEMTAKDAGGLVEAAASIPVGSRVNVTFLAQEQPAARIEAVRALVGLGLVPVPHLAARRLASRQQLDDYLSALVAEGGAEHAFVIAGDPKTPEGPYADALAVIESGALEQAGVRHVGISGYPDGHPDIDQATLWDALERKSAALGEQGLDGSVITQFGFDADAVLTWAEQVRGRGIDLPIRIGVPGPAGVKRLLGYATRFGVGTSAGIARKYGLSLTNLMGSAGPDRFLGALADGYDPDRHGELRLHFYTFGGLATTAQWIAAFRAAA